MFILFMSLYYLQSFVTIFARQKYRQNKCCFYIIALCLAQGYKNIALSGL